MKKSTKLLLAIILMVSTSNTPILSANNQLPEVSEVEIFEQYNSFDNQADITQDQTDITQDQTDDEDNFLLENEVPDLSEIDSSGQLDSSDYQIDDEDDFQLETEIPNLNEMDSTGQLDSFNNQQDTTQDPILEEDNSLQEPETPELGEGEILPSNEEEISTVVQDDTTNLAACDLAYEGFSDNEGLFGPHSWINKVTSPCGDIVDFIVPSSFLNRTVLFLGDGINKVLVGFNATGILDLPTVLGIRANAFSETSFSTLKFSRITHPSFVFNLVIGNYAFHNVPFTSIYVDGEAYSVPTKTSSIGVGAFSGALVEEFYIPSTVSTATNMFLGNTSIRRIYIDSEKAISSLRNTDFGASNLEGVYFKVKNTWMNLPEGSSSNSNLIQGSGYDTKEIAQAEKDVVNQFVTNSMAGTTVVAGWKKAGDPVMYTTEQTFVLNENDTVYYPVYRSIHTVTFEPNNGGAQWTENAVDGNPLVSPTPPTRVGHAFGGWHADENLTVPWDFSANVTSNMTLYAKWEVVDSLVIEAKNAGIDTNLTSYTEEQLLTMFNASASMENEGSLVVVDIDDQQVADFNVLVGETNLRKGGKFQFTLNASNTVDGVFYEASKTVYMYYSGMGVIVIRETNMPDAPVILFVTGDPIIGNSYDELVGMTEQELMIRGNISIVEIATGADITGTINNLTFTMNDSGINYNVYPEALKYVDGKVYYNFLFDVVLSNGDTFSAQHNRATVDGAFENSITKIIQSTEGYIVYVMHGFTDLNSEIMDENGNVVDLLASGEASLMRQKLVGINSNYSREDIQLQVANDVDRQEFINSANLGGIFPLHFEVEVNDGSNAHRLAFEPLLSIFLDGRYFPIPGMVVIMCMNYRDFSLSQSDLARLDEQLFIEESRLSGSIQSGTGIVMDSNHPVLINSEDLATLGQIRSDGGIQEVRLNIEHIVNTESGLLTGTGESIIKVLVEGDKYIASTKGLDGDVLYLKTDTTNFNFTMEELEQLSEAELLNRVGFESKMLNTGKVADVQIVGFDDMIANGNNGIYNLQVKSTVTQNRHDYNVIKTIHVTVGIQRTILFNSGLFAEFGSIGSGIRQKELVVPDGFSVKQVFEAMNEAERSEWNLALTTTSQDGLNFRRRVGEWFTTDSFADAYYEGAPITNVYDMDEIVSDASPNVLYADVGDFREIAFNSVAPPGHSVDANLVFYSGDFESVNSGIVRKEMILRYGTIPKDIFDSMSELERAKWEIKYDTSLYDKLQMQDSPWVNINGNYSSSYSRAVEGSTDSNLYPIILKRAGSIKLHSGPLAEFGAVGSGIREVEIKIYEGTESYTLFNLLLLNLQFNIILSSDVDIAYDQDRYVAVEKFYTSPQFTTVVDDELPFIITYGKIDVYVRMIPLIDITLHSGINAEFGSIGSGVREKILKVPEGSTVRETFNEMSEDERNEYNLVFDNTTLENRDMKRVGEWFTTPTFADAYYDGAPITNVYDMDAPVTDATPNDLYADVDKLKEITFHSVAPPDDTNLSQLVLYSGVFESENSGIESKRMTVRYGKILKDIFESMPELERPKWEIKYDISLYDKFLYIDSPWLENSGFYTIYYVSPIGIQSPRDLYPMILKRVGSIKMYSGAFAEFGTIGSGVRELEFKIYDGMESLDINKIMIINIFAHIVEEAYLNTAYDESKYELSSNWYTNPQFTESVIMTAPYIDTYGYSDIYIRLTPLTIEDGIIPGPGNPDTPMWGVQVPREVVLEKDIEMDVKTKLVSLTGYEESISTDLNVDLYIRSQNRMRLKRDDPSSTEELKYRVDLGSASLGGPNYNQGQIATLAGTFTTTNRRIEGSARLLEEGMVRDVYKDKLIFSIQVSTVAP